MNVMKRWLGTAALAALATVAAMSTGASTASAHEHDGGYYGQRRVAIRDGWTGGWTRYRTYGRRSYDNSPQIYGSIGWGDPDRYVRVRYNSGYGYGGYGDPGWCPPQRRVVVRRVYVDDGYGYGGYGGGYGYYGHRHHDDDDDDD